MFIFMTEKLEADWRLCACVCVCVYPHACVSGPVSCGTSVEGDQVGDQVTCLEDPLRIL